MQKSLKNIQRIKEGFPLEKESPLYYSKFLKRTLNYSKSAAISNEIIVITKMIFLNVMYDPNRNKEKVQKIANVIVAFVYYQKEIKIAFLILLSNHQIAK